MRSYVVLFSTMTVDGRIASRTGYSRLSCLEDLELLHKLRASSDAVMVGANTVISDNPRLTTRLVAGPSPKYRVVVDARLRVPPTARVFESPNRGVLVTLDKWSDEDLAKYLDRGVKVIKAGKDEIDLKLALTKLYEIGIRRLLVEGGGTLNCSMLASGLVDEIRVTVAPYVFGSGVSLAECEAFDGEHNRVELSLVEYWEVCPGWLHLVYRVVRPKNVLP
ncbi:MAG: 2,5-diamino-6-(ribosylamino)-4(3H)-pyrimidinone 5'-phosphate reductase [Acidilobaceae archaeon]